MPVHGKGTSILFGAYNVSNWFNNIATSETQEIAETTGFQDLDKTYVLGASDAKVTAQGRFEGQVGQIRDIVYSQIKAQGDVPVTVGWGVGIKAGNPAEFGQDLTNNWVITSPVGGIVTTGLDTMVDGGLGHGLHLLDLAARPVGSLVNGPTQQLVVPIAPGLSWGAAFHRVAATGTAAETVKVQTSADGTTWVDLPGASATFPAYAGGAPVNGGGAPVGLGSAFVSGNAPVAGPYVRAVSTITGTGTSTTLIAFGLY